MRSTFILISLATAIVAVAITTVFVADRDGRTFSSCKFDRAAWDRGRLETVPAHRYEALAPEVADIVKCDAIVYGKTGAEVEALLGTPERSKPDSWSYGVGIPSNASEYGTLVLQFDPTAGRVKAASVPQHVEK